MGDSWSERAEPDDGASPRGRSGRPGAGEEWYRDGLAFECTMCGNCCTGPEGVVWFSKDEGREMAKAVGVSEGDFYRDFARKVGNRWSLREVVLEKNGESLHDCIFLDRTTSPGKAMCRVYLARPTQCRTWPFWPENLTTRRAWNNAKGRAPCPGMDSGKLIPIERIRVLRDQNPP